MKILIALIFLVPFSNGISQKGDSAFIRSIYDEALLRGEAHENLRSLCKDIGARITGSASAEMAIFWSEKLFQKYNFDKVYLQKIRVPHWERGTKESAWFIDKKGKIKKLNVLALGGSVPSDGLISSGVIEFESLEELKKASSKKVKGKIVFLNEKMNAHLINTFKAYGQCYPIRRNGASEASKLGAKAIIIRSLALPVDEHPHTGSLHYQEGIKKIPAAAISTMDADFLSNTLNKARWGKKNAQTINLELNCRLFSDKDSYNVIAEMKGKSKPEEIITFGGHLDSWDTGEGAHDDGAGVIHCLEALRILKELNYKPIHTLRLVFFMNEENGNRGGEDYASIAFANGEKQIAAVESDRGGFAPRGFSCDGTDLQINLLKQFESLFAPYELHVFEKGYGGVDIGPLKKHYKNIPLFGFVPDSQRYFDFHHSPNDVFENVNKRELELGAASISSLLYLLDLNL